MRHTLILYHAFCQDPTFSLQDELTQVDHALSPSLHFLSSIHLIPTSLYSLLRTQQTRDVGPMLGWRWASVVDGGPASVQHWANAIPTLGQRWPNAGLTSGQCRRRWASVSPTLGQHNSNIGPTPRVFSVVLASMSICYSVWHQRKSYKLTLLCGFISLVLFAYSFLSLWLLW